MTGRTHRAGGYLCSIVGFALLREKGLLLEGVYPMLQWIVMYPFCMWGSVVSDLDHHWESCPMHDPPSYVINKALHPTQGIKNACEKSGDTRSSLYKFAKTFNASHRSWQTHSDLTLFCFVSLVYWVLNYGSSIGVINAVLLRVILLGASLGIIAHFILDMLTTDGVDSLVLKAIKAMLRKLNPRIKRFPTKLRFVPRMRCFRTNGSWEEWVYRLIKVLNILATLYLLWSILGVGSLFPYEITFN